MKRLVIHVKIAVFRNVYKYLHSHNKGNSLRKSPHNHCCYFGFTLEVRVFHVSYICTAISESGNTNSQVSNPKALMHWFSQLISVSLGGFDVNCTDNISTLQNSIMYIKKKNVTLNLMGRGVLQCSHASRPWFTVSDIPAAAARESYISDQ